MDNIGPYLKYDEFITELKLSGSNVVIKIRDITLGGKTADPGGAIFTYTVTSDIVKVGDVINQLGRSAIVVTVLTGPNRIQLEDISDGTTDVVNGDAEILRADSIPRFRGEEIILTAMDLIDEHTGQFFNKRSGVFQLEGANHPTMWFPVPIIDITELLINSTDLTLKEGEDFDFFAFKGRSEPQDDRRNPRIKLNVGRGRDSIFTGSITNRIFAKDTLSTFTGSFGFLQLDGSTPSLITRATLILSAKEINQSSVSSDLTSGTGPVRRRKVDLHEKEFFENKGSTARGSQTGIPEVDRIITKFHTPIRVGGSIQISNFAESNRSMRVF